MDQLSRPAPPASSTPSRPPAHQPAAPPLRSQWSLARQRIFLVALIEFGCVARAARAAGMSRSSAHRLRQRLAGTAFDRGWAEALARHARRQSDPFSPDAYPHARPPERPAASAPAPRPRR